jgi:UDP-N-acetylmuramoylalanine--D-glutamate ligase
MGHTQEAKDNFVGLRALVVGLAREGTALARFLAEHGAQVTVTDAKPAEALVHSLNSLSGLPMRYALGSHPWTLLDDTEIVFVSPGVPLDSPFLMEAQRRGLPLSSETRLLSRLCPAQIVGITGSSGKTTTTALVGSMLEAAGRRTWVGGNIGSPLIGLLDQMTPSDAVVMELSSFQLELFAPWSQGERRTRNNQGYREAVCDPAGWSPPIAAILNITPNHLDRHPTMEAYMAAKLQVLSHQQAGDVAILNLDNPVTRQMGEARSGKQQVLWFSQEQAVDQGTFLDGGTLVLRLGTLGTPVCREDELKLLGRHNVANALAACALAAAAGVPVEVLRQVLLSFRGVEHRLELVRVRNDVRWYNDSIATTPERAVAALQSFDAPIILLAGGRDKHLSWNEMAALTWRKARHLITFGEATALIHAAMRESQPGSQSICQIHDAGQLEPAVQLAAQVAQPGDVVLLSPGGTSFDAYADFVARGEHFRQLVNDLE